MAKLSVSLPDIVAGRARRAAERAGLPLSTWLAQAAEVAAEPDPDELAQIRGQLADVGVGKPEAPEEVAARRAVLARLLGVTDQRRAG